MAWIMALKGSKFVNKMKMTNDKYQNSKQMITKPPAGAEAMARQAKIWKHEIGKVFDTDWQDISKSERWIVYGEQLTV